MPSHSHSHFFVFYTVVCLIITPVLIQLSSVWYRKKGIKMLFQTRYSARLSAPNWSTNQLNSGGKLGEAATAPHLAGHMIYQLREHVALTVPVKMPVISCHRGHWAPMHSAKGRKHSGIIADVSRLFAFSKSEEKFKMFLHIMCAANRSEHLK